MLQTGLLDGKAFTNLQSSVSQPVDLLKSALAISLPGNYGGTPQAQVGESTNIEHGEATSNADASLQAENEKLKQQLLEAQEAAAQWQKLHTELHKFCVDKVLTTAQT